MGVPFFLLPLSPNLMSTHRAPFRLFKQVNRMRGGGVGLDRPLLVSWPSLLFSSHVTPAQTPVTTHSSELTCINSLPCSGTRCQRSTYLPADTPLPPSLALSLSIFLPLLALLFNSGGGATGCIYILYVSTTKETSWASLVQPHTHTCTLTQQEDYTCLVWVGWELSGKAHCIFVASRRLWS